MAVVLKREQLKGIAKAIDAHIARLTQRQQVHCDSPRLPRRKLVPTSRDLLDMPTKVIVGVFDELEAHEILRLGATSKAMRDFVDRHAHEASAFKNLGVTFRLYDKKMANEEAEDEGIEEPGNRQIVLVNRDASPRFRRQVQLPFIGNTSTATIKELASGEVMLERFEYVLPLILKHLHITEISFEGLFSFDFVRFCRIAARQPVKSLVWNDCFGVGDQDLREAMNVFRRTLREVRMEDGLAQTISEFFFHNPIVINLTNIVISIDCWDQGGSIHMTDSFLLASRCEELNVTSTGRYETAISAQGLLAWLELFYQGHRDSVRLIKFAPAGFFKTDKWRDLQAIQPKYLPWSGRDVLVSRSGRVLTAKIAEDGIEFEIIRTRVRARAQSNLV